MPNLATEPINIRLTKEAKSVIEQAACLLAIRLKR